MNEYTLDQLLYSAVIRGYADKRQAKRWADDHAKQIYTEDDLIDLYHDCHKETIRHLRPKGLAVDGQDVESQGRRTYGKSNKPSYRSAPVYSFATIMRYEQSINDKIQQAWRKGMREEHDAD